MAKRSNKAPEQRLVDGLFWLGASACGMAAVLLIAAVAWPIEATTAAADKELIRTIEALPEPNPNVTPLVRKMAGSRLIRPAQAQAAVKDSGAADRLLAQLKLTGVVELGGELVAYVRVEKDGVKSVRPNDKILDFTVEKVQPGSVTLNLEGVIRELRY